MLKRYAIPLPNLLLGLFDGDSFPLVKLAKSPSDGFDRFGALGSFEQPLVRSRVLDDDRRLAVNGEEHWPPRLLEMLDELSSVFREGGKRFNFRPGVEHRGSSA